MRTFRSDNNAGVCPEAMAAINEANDGHALGYGDDGWTTDAFDAFADVFEADPQEMAIFFVATGTSANVLSIASLTEPWQQVICHGHSHYNDDESTAPERMTHCRAAAIDTQSSKITTDLLEPVLARGRGDVHQPQPGVLTLSNTTEFGTIYTPDELAELSAMAHAGGYRVHVDGARFANAVAALDCSPRELVIDTGIDALSFGGTKNGLAMGEAVVFFRQGDGSAFERARTTFEFHRKGTGHLLSKHRFVSAPFAATLRDGIWLTHARHANAMAQQLSEQLVAIDLNVRYPTQANGVFVTLDQHVHGMLEKRGHGYYPFGDPDWSMYRLMCSFDTQPGEISGFVEDARAALSVAGT